MRSTVSFRTLSSKTSRSILLWLTKFSSVRISALLFSSFSIFSAFFLLSFDAAFASEMALVSEFPDCLHHSKVSECIRSSVSAVFCTDAMSILHSVLSESGMLVVVFLCFLLNCVILLHHVELLKRFRAAYSLVVYMLGSVCLVMRITLLSRRH